MNKIKVMDEILANKIAAGEVIEKCVSIVKELVENSIDAKSSKIRVDLINSGVGEIKVTDDGIGMSESDAILAFQRHATSKLLSEMDLFNMLITFHFTQGHFFCLIITWRILYQHVLYINVSLN